MSAKAILSRWQQTRDRYDSGNRAARACGKGDGRWMLAHATHDEVSLLLVIALVALSAGILFGLQLASRSLGTRSKKR